MASSSASPIARSAIIPFILVLCLAAPAASASAAQGPAAVALAAPDGTKLAATYFPAAAAGPGLLLLHQCNRDRSAWAALATDAAARGYHVLTMDFRGYGESGGKRFENFQEQQPVIEKQWPGDVDAAFAWLATRPGVDRSRIGIGGASCGVNQAILAARRHPEVKTLVLLSGATTQDGWDYLKQAAAVPILAAASRNDGDAVTTLRWTIGWSRNPANTFLEFKAAGHGTEMFGVEKTLEPAILEWLDTRLRDAAPAPADAAASKPTVIEEFWTALTSPGGLERAFQLYDLQRRRDPKVVLFPESEMNAYGYRRLQAGHPAEAVDIFSFNIDAYPRSAMAYDSLSDAYLAAGKRKEALEAAERALKLLKNDKSMTDDVRKLVRESLERKIQDLR